MPTATACRCASIGRLRGRHDAGTGAIRAWTRLRPGPAKFPIARTPATRCAWNRCGGTSWKRCAPRCWRSPARWCFCCSSRAPTSQTCCWCGPLCASENSPCEPPRREPLGLVRQMLAEAVMLVGAGAGLGVALAQSGIRELLRDCARATCRGSTPSPSTRVSWRSRPPRRAAVGGTLRPGSGLEGFETGYHAACCAAARAPPG